MHGQMEDDLITGHTARIQQIYKSRDIESSLKDYSDIIFVLAYLSNSLYDGNVKLKSYQKFLEILLFKLIEHAGSAVDAIKGLNRRTHIESKTLTHIDLSSAYVLFRAIMESYLLNYYLNFDATDDVHGNFRMLLFERSGLKRRQTYEVTQQEGIEKLAKEKLEIEELTKEIQSNAYFQSLSPQRQKYLLTKDEAKELSYEDIIKKRGIINPQFYIMWRLYSNYAHSEFISLIQLKDYVANPTIVKANMNAAFMDQTLLLVLQITDLVKNFHSARIAYNKLPTDLYASIEARIRLLQGRFFEDSRPT